MRLLSLNLHVVNGAIMRSQEFRENADKCEKLALESSDAFIREALIELAADFRHAAEILERREAQPSIQYPV